MNIIVRNEIKNDYQRCEELAREAFWNLYFPGAEEHYVVHKMRDHKDFIKQLSFVIEVDGQVEGAIYFTHSKIVAENNTYETVSFGPVFISPLYHRKGLGRILISHAIEEAKNMGFRAIMILGYPYHYKPYGFCGGKKYGIAMEDGNYYTGLLVLPLYEGALKGCHGYAKFSDIFEVDKNEVEKFDKLFPLKEKLVLPCQKEYEIACAMLDE